MAIPTELGPLNAALKRRWGIVGPEGPVVTIGSDVFPSARADLGRDADQFFLGDEKVCAAGRLDGATAGVQSSVGLENPDASGIIAVITGLSVWTSSSQVVQLTLAGPVPGSTPFDASANGGIRDAGPQLIGEGGEATCIIGDRSDAVAGNGVQLGSLVPEANRTENYSYMGPWVLRPDSRLTVNGESTNTAIRVNFVWTERRAGTWELGA